jgi:hypothetical protein
MPEQPDDKDFTALAKGLEGSKVFAVMVVVFYVIGFLVVTFRLAQFGFVPVSWLRPQYLLAGIWCLLPTLLFVWIASFIPWQVPEYKRFLKIGRRLGPGKYGHILAGVLAAGALYACIEMALMLVEMGTGQRVTLGFWGERGVASLKLVAFYLAAIGSAIWGMVLTNRALNSSKRPTIEFVTKCSVASLVLCFSLAMAVGYIRYFSTTVYALIPSAIGGGRPQSVVFLLDKEHGEPPVTPDSSGTRSVPYQLLLKTDSSYVVQSQKAGETAIEFRQESVKGMVVLDH